MYKDSVRDHTYTRNKIHYENHIKPFFGQLLIKKISEIEIEKWQNRLLNNYAILTVVKFRSIFS